MMSMSSPILWWKLRSCGTLDYDNNVCGCSSPSLCTLISQSSFPFLSLNPWVCEFEGCLWIQKLAPSITPCWYTFPKVLFHPRNQLCPGSRQHLLYVWSRWTTVCIMHGWFTSTKWVLVLYKNKIKYTSSLRFGGLWWNVGELPFQMCCGVERPAERQGAETVLHESSLFRSAENL